MCHVKECPRCGEAVIWTRTAKGNAMPVDATPIAWGKYALEGEDDDVRAVFLRGDYYGPRYRCHLESCPGPEAGARRARRSHRG